MARKRKLTHATKRSRKIFWRRIVLGSSTVIVMASLSALIYFGTRATSLSISTVAVEGTETLEPARITERANSLLAGSYYGVIPYRFMYLFPHDRLVSVIKEMPRISTVDVWRQGAALTIAVTEHAPAMLWCGSGEGGDCYYVDDAGEAYEKAPQLSGNTLTRFVIDGVEPKQGDSLLSSDVRAGLLAMARTMEERHDFRVSRIEYAENGDVTLSLTGGGRIQLSTQNDLETTYANLASILSSDEFAHLEPGNFERIDLRFGSKVFVQEEPVVASTTASTSAEVE